MVRGMNTTPPLGYCSHVTAMVRVRESLFGIFHDCPDRDPSRVFPTYRHMEMALVTWRWPQSHGDGLSYIEMASEDGEKESSSRKEDQSEGLLRFTMQKTTRRIVNREVIRGQRVNYS